MAIKSILNNNQQKILQLLSNEPDIYNNFCLTGGTALAEFYLSHRYSEDLDFFSEKEFEPQSVSVILKSMQKKIKAKKIEFQQSFNRNLFFLHLENEVIKIEFTFFPFAKIASGPKVNQLSIESLIDVAVNKMFTIYQNPRSRDFIDLYFIIQKENFSIDELVKKTKIKFDWHVDPIQLGSQFLKATTLKDYPRMIEKIDDKKWIAYFRKQAKELKKKIVN